MWFTALCLAAVLRTGYACSNLLISKGASADGSVIMSYTADDDSLFGSLDLRPAADHAPGSVRQMWVSLCGGWAHRSAAISPSI